MCALCFYKRLMRVNLKFVQWQWVSCSSPPLYKGLTLSPTWAGGTSPWGWGQCSGGPHPVHLVPPVLLQPSESQHTGRHETSNTIKITSHCTATLCLSFSCQENSAVSPVTSCVRPNLRLSSRSRSLVFAGPEIDNYLRRYISIV